MAGYLSNSIQQQTNVDTGEAFKVAFYATFSSLPISLHWLDNEIVFLYLGFKIGSRLLCKNQDDSKLKPQLVQCRCQPGYEIVNSNGKKQCHLCDKGSFSTDGIKCARCEAGHVALRGKHFYVWRNNTLPHGFFTDCFGDCSVKVTEELKALRNFLN